MDRRLGAIGTRYRGFHGVRILGSEVEDLSDLDAPRLYFVFGAYFALKASSIVDVVGRGVDRSPLLDDRVEITVIINLLARHREIEHVLVAIDGGLPGLREHNEFVAEIAADGTGLGAHRDRLQPHAREGP